MNIGFTGTQDGLKSKQLNSLLTVFERFDTITTFHHGDCVGADKIGCIIAKDLGAKLICHPPDNPSKRCFFESDETREEKPYLERNHDIVNESDLLIACPKGMNEELRSGTWATVRYARKVGLKVYIIYPDGNIK